MRVLYVTPFIINDIQRMKAGSVSSGVIVTDQLIMKG